MNQTNLVVIAISQSFQKPEHLLMGFSKTKSNHVRFFFKEDWRFLESVTFFTTLALLADFKRQV